MSEAYDVVVVGAGNAAFCAALAARDGGARVVLLEKAPRQWMGGNSYFTAGAFRTTYEGLDDLRRIVPDITDEEAHQTDLPPYTPVEFIADMQRVTRDKCDAELTAILANDAGSTMNWLFKKGLRFRLMYDRQSFQVGGRRRFWGGLVLGAQGGGKGLLQQYLTLAERNGIEIRYECPVVGLLQDGDACTGVVISSPNGPEEVRAGAVVLAAGGFEASPEMRAKYLGQIWRTVKVRGTPYNTGEVLRIALAMGAQPYGDWTGCHSIAWDAAAPATGDREITNLFSRQSYPLGIVVNQDGRRFLDEGADYRNYTYAKYGAEILRQPGGIAFQIFDGKTEPLLRQDEYTAPGVSRYEALTITELAAKLGIDPVILESTVNEFNKAVQPGEFNPAVKDGKHTLGVAPPKSNWALTIDTPPYLAFTVTCGITFTFGGVKVDASARVLDRYERPLLGLYAVGELMGGLFYHNYPGGSGLMAGSVFGRRAGHAAAEHAAARQLASG